MLEGQLDLRLVVEAVADNAVGKSADDSGEFKPGCSRWPLPIRPVSIAAGDSGEFKRHSHTCRRSDSPCFNRGGRFWGV